MVSLGQHESELGHLFSQCDPDQIQSMDDLDKEWVKRMIQVSFKLFGTLQMNQISEFFDDYMHCKETAEKYEGLLQDMEGLEKKNEELQARVDELQHILEENEDSIPSLIPDYSSKSQTPTVDQSSSKIMQIMSSKFHPPS